MKKLAKTKILYIGPIPPEVGGRTHGGIATHAWELAIQAHKRGYDVYILANATSSFVKDGVKVISPPLKNKLSRAFYGVKFWLMLDKSRINFLNFLGFREKLGVFYRVFYRAYCLRQVLESVKPDLIHVHSLHNWYNLSLKILRVPISVVISDHGAFWGIIEEEDLARVSAALSIASRVICVSQQVKKRLEQLGLNYRTKPAIIHNPISIDKLPFFNREELRKQWSDEKKTVFFSGVYEPIRRKGLDVLLRAFSVDDYLKDNCRLIILTRGEGVRYAEESISQNEIDGLVLSLRPWDEIVKYYNVADVFVMPSKFEPFGLVYIEALLAGTPVVGCSGILREIEGLLGIYIGEKFDASHEGEKELAQKIIKVLNTDFDREILRTKMVENLSWDAKFNEFDAVYREVLRNRKKSVPKNSGPLQ